MAAEASGPLVNLWLQLTSPLVFFSFAAALAFAISIFSSLFAVVSLVRGLVSGASKRMQMPGLLLEDDDDNKNKDADDDTDDDDLTMDDR